MDSYNVGLDAIEQFFIHSSRLNPDRFNFTWNDFLADIENNNDGIIEKIGDYISHFQVSMQNVDSKMLKLAIECQGGVPDSSEVYLDILMGKEVEFKVAYPDPDLKNVTNQLLNDGNMNGLMEVSVKSMTFVKDNYKAILILSLLGFAGYYSYKNDLIGKTRKLLSL